MLAKAVYQLAESLPQHERYNLASQIRRSAPSVPLNTAESYGRYTWLNLNRRGL